LKSLQGSDKWLYDLLYAFNSGNIKKFEDLRPTWSKQDDLKKESALLERKIRLLSLMEMAFARPSKDRQISFKEIADMARIDIDEVS
jgi:26S proteasome regulatory subunit N9